MVIGNIRLDDRQGEGGPAHIPRDLRYHSAAGRFLRTLLARRGSTLVNLDAAGRLDLHTLRETRELVPLLMQDVSALHIQCCVRAARRLDGAMAEAGVFMGGSARLICEAKGGVPLHLFDIFEGLQDDTGASLDAAGAEIRSHFGKVHGRLSQVERLLARYDDVHLHPGIFPGSAGAVRDARFSFVHLDMDLARSTCDALEFFHPRLVPGGILIGDDYGDPGVRDAFAIFFSRSHDTIIELPWAQVMVVKQRN